VEARDDLVERHGDEALPGRHRDDDAQVAVAVQYGADVDPPCHEGAEQALDRVEDLEAVEGS
jgi:hypothetical protein